MKTDEASAEPRRIRWARIVLGALVVLLLVAVLLAVVTLARLSPGKSAAQLPKRPSAPSASAILAVTPNPLGAVFQNAEVSIRETPGWRAEIRELMIPYREDDGTLRNVTVDEIFLYQDSAVGSDPLGRIEVVSTLWPFKLYSSLEDMFTLENASPLGSTPRWCAPPRPAPLPNGPPNGMSATKCYSITADRPDPDFHPASGRLADYSLNALGADGLTTFQITVTAPEDSLPAVLASAEPALKTIVWKLWKP